MGARERLLALPADATATEVLCAALGCDRRGLSSVPGGAARALAGAMADVGPCDAGALLGLAAELEEASAEWRGAEMSMAPGRLSLAVGLVSDDFAEVARRVRSAVGGR